MKVLVYTPVLRQRRPDSQAGTPVWTRRAEMKGAELLPRVGEEVEIELDATPGLYRCVRVRQRYRADGQEVLIFLSPISRQPWGTVVGEAGEGELPFE